MNLLLNMNKLHSQILHVISNQATLITNREKCGLYEYVRG